MIIQSLTFINPPLNGVMLDVKSNVVSCGMCQEVVYPDVVVLAEHDLTWDGHRMTWYSRAFDTIVHLCASDVSENQRGAGVAIRVWETLNATKRPDVQPS